MDYSTEFPFWREFMTGKVLKRLGNLLLELRELSQGGEFVVQSIDNEVRWLKIHLEFFEPEEYGEDLFIDARKIGYHVGQLLESTCSTHQEKCEVVKDMLRSYCRIVDNYIWSSHFVDLDYLDPLHRILKSARALADPVENDYYERGSILGDYMSEWLIHQGDQGLSSSASGVQVLDVDEDEDFVGLKEQVDSLVAHLVNEGGSSSTGTGTGYYNVISVCGMGGLGKTTIAKAIFNHPVVWRHFHGFIWSSMSSNEGRDGDILYGILSNLLPGNMFRSILAIEDMEYKLQELERLVKNQLQLRKCLIVLDDICSPIILSILRKTISMNMNSRILVTSRNSKLPFHLSHECLIYAPKFLNEDESWELLLRKASKNRGKCTWKDMNGHLTKGIWKELVIRCGGLPLAFVELGELMSRMKLEEVIKEEEQCSREMLLVPTKFKSFPMQGRVLEVLFTSYNELPHELRSCFCYLRNIEANLEIGVNRLCQLWIAESLIPNRYTTMGIARYCLEVLASRSMVQLQIDESTGFLKSCRLHTLLRHICFLKGNEEDLHVMDLRSGRVEKEVTMPSPSSISKINKLVIHLGDLNDVDKYVPLKREIACKLHSLLFFLERYSLKPKISRLVQSRLSDFKMVQVLDLGGLVFSKLHKSIGKLKHLKYLGLRYAVFHELPSTIANMKDLQTLDLWDDNTQYAFTSIPNVLWKLSELRHLYLRSLPSSSAQHGRRMRLNGLRNLETLENFDTRVFNADELIFLRNLRKLGAKVCNKLDLKKIINCLKFNTSNYFLSHVAISIKYCDLYSEEGQSLLKKLLCCHVLCELSIDGRTGKLPGYNNNFSKCLSTVTLESCELKEDPMVTLEKLPNLRSLFLKWNAYVGVKMVCSATGFPQLRVLQMHRIWKVNEWIVDEGGMPNLSSLEISFCPNLKTIPHGLQFITTLQKLEIIWMPKEFCSRLQWEDNKRGEDFYKVQHVSSIKIIDFDGTQKVYQKSNAIAQIGVFIRGGTLGPFGVNTRPDKGKGKAIESSTDEDEYVSDNEMVWEMAWADKGKGKTIESNTDEYDYVSEMDFVFRNLG